MGMLKLLARTSAWQDGARDRLDKKACAYQRAGGGPAKH